jgi:predicted SAM-dependent methyltransferase
LNSVTELLRGGNLSLSQFTQTVLLALPNRYELWLLLAQARLPALLSATFDSNATVEVDNLVLKSEEALVVLGLSVFPSSPELLYLRALQLQLRARHLGQESEHRSCVQHFATAASSKAALWSSDAALLESMTRVVDTAIPADPPASCVPELSRHTVQSYQDTYRTISALYESSDTWHAVGDILHQEDTSEPNQVAASSVVAAQVSGDPTATRYLPSLQVGCSQHAACALPGFLIADALPAVSTHFLTEAYHLEMVDDSSVGLVYSSHTLEHLSHNLPPARCPTHPKPDVSVRGCGSEVQEALREWRRVLAPGGQLLVSAPDLEALAAYFVHPDTSSAERAVLQVVLFGGQHNVYDFHKTGLFYALLQTLLREAGFCDVQRVPAFGIFADTSSKVLSAGKPLSVNVRATAC